MERALKVKQTQPANWGTKVDKLTSPCIRNPLDVGDPREDKRSIRFPKRERSYTTLLGHVVSRKGNP